jgi:sigma-B regulation protein RsbU (phosphoserine phosphatase)
MSLLPKIFPIKDGYEIAGICMPSRSVGGDFYDWYQVNEDEVAFTLADVMGKGISSAIIAATVRAVFRSTFRQPDLKIVMETVAEILEEDLVNSGKFATLFHARMHKDIGALEYIDAGHGLVSIMRVNGDIEYLESQNLPLGIHTEEPWAWSSTRLDIGDTLIATSDGVLELLDKQASNSMDGFMKDIANTLRASSVQEIIKNLEAKVISQSPPDDVTLLILRRSY